MANQARKKRGEDNEFELDFELPLDIDFSELDFELPLDIDFSELLELPENIFKETYNDYKQ